MITYIQTTHRETTCFIWYTIIYLISMLITYMQTAHRETQLVLYGILKYI
jgi:hypothetical protein